MTDRIDIENRRNRRITFRNETNASFHAGADFNESGVPEVIARADMLWSAFPKSTRLFYCDPPYTYENELIDPYDIVAINPDHLFAGDWIDSEGNAICDIKSFKHFLKQLLVRPERGSLYDPTREMRHDNQSWHLNRLIMSWARYPIRSLEFLLMMTIWMGHVYSPTKKEMQELVSLSEGCRLIYNRQLDIVAGIFEEPPLDPDVERTRETSLLVQLANLETWNRVQSMSLFAISKITHQIGFIMNRLHRPVRLACQRLNIDSNTLDDAPTRLCPFCGSHRLYQGKFRHFFLKDKHTVVFCSSCLNVISRH